MLYKAVSRPRHDRLLHLIEYFQSSFSLHHSYAANIQGNDKYPIILHKSKIMGLQ